VIPTRFTSAVPLPADTLWGIVCNFGACHTFVDCQSGVFFLQASGGEGVGATRDATLNGRPVRQRLLAYSDSDRCYTYELCGRPPFPIEFLVTTTEVKPVIGAASSVLEWNVSFDAPLGARRQITRQLEKSFAVWVESLRRAILDAIELDASS
jgi:Polyketide cyclase / dehydrase and lipid transport